MFRTALIGIGLALGGPVAAAGQERATVGRKSCETTTAIETLASVTGQGEVRTASGRVVTLAGVRLAEEGDDRARALAWIAEAVGGTVEIAAVGSNPDRWGRVAADVTLRHEGGSLDLARSLVAAGLALVDAGEADVLCRADLFAVEARARAAELGLWRSPRYKPLSADDLSGLMDRIGRFALVEGRIQSVGERRQRTYLNFGTDWATDLTITLPKRSWDILRGRGHTAATLRGQRIRARGLIESWQGPALTIVAVDLLELLDGGGSQERPWERRPQERRWRDQGSRER